MKYGYRLNSANCQSARLVGVDPQIDPKRGYIVQALRFRADEGIGSYGTSFTLQVLILPILLTKADTHINNSEAVSADYTNKAGEGH